MAQSKLEILIQARNNAKKEFDSLNKQVNQLQGGAGGKGGGLKGLNTAFQKFTGISLAAGGAIGIASMAVKKLAEYSKVAIAAASDMQETQSKVNVVFGDAADKVLKFGKTAAESMGMSNEAALAGAAVYGNLFRAMGITEEVSADMSMRLVQLASDLASFNNMDPTEVLDKLRSGLSGEVEPLRSLGVNLNQVIIQEKALELGLWDGVGALSAAEKAQASYALILEQTSLAQGDFERTSEGLANQQRIQAALQEDLATIIGEYLLPAQTALIESQNKLTKQTIDYIQGLQDEKEQIERLGLVYDQHLGYMKDGILLTAEQVNEMKRADRANQAWTESLEAQGAAWLKLHPEIQTGIKDYSALAEEIIGVDAYMKDYTKSLLFQQAAAGLSAEESRALAEAMGLVKTETAWAMDQTQKYRDQLANGEITLEEYIALVDGLANTMDRLENKEVVITLKGLIDPTAGKIITMTGGGQSLNIGKGVTREERAAGGPVGANRPYLVGEVGPELFVPNQSGQIIPNNQLGGSKVVNFYYSPAFSLSDRAEVETKIKPMLKELLSEV